MVLTKAGWLSMMLCVTGSLSAQVQQDSVTTKRLDEVTIQGEKEVNVERLPDIEGTRIWSGKKDIILK